MDEIELLELRPVQRGNLKAFASVQIGVLEINGLRVIQQPNQRAFVHLPMFEFTGKDGEKCYAPLIRLHDAQLEKEIKSRVLSEWLKQQHQN